MASLKVSIPFLLIVASAARASVFAPALGPAPVVAPAISYTRAIPYNVPPFAASVNVFSRLAHAHPVFHAAPVLSAAPLAAGFLPPIAPHAALHAPVFPGLLPQARSIHPPGLLPGVGLPPVAAHALAGPLPYSLPAGPFAAPLPHTVPAPLPHALAPLAGPLPHPLAAPLPPVWRR